MNAFVTLCQNTNMCYGSMFVVCGSEYGTHGEIMKIKGKYDQLRVIRPDIGQ